MDLYQFDQQMRNEGYQRIAGVDEAGRGPLAGPVVAAACIIPPHLHFPSINDSKQLTEEEREDLFHLLTTNPEVEYAIGMSDANLIDQKNILRATFLAMNQAIDAISPPPDCLLIDGKFLPQTKVHSEAVIKGDAKSLCIAAASIIAKFTRDQIMIEMGKNWPQYGFERHKGYGTDEHLSAIKKYGIIPDIHRKTFQPIKEMLTPDLFSNLGVTFVS